MTAEARPKRKPRSYDGVKAHYTLEQLDELERYARGMCRMDLTDKMKLINMARYALMLEVERDEYKNRWMSSFT